MYLIDCEDYSLKFYHRPAGLEYLILSHTWGDDEVTFRDMTTDLEAAKAKRGFAKIRGACAAAKRRGIPYAWVDTCCIDKRSSAELSESINSMFKWYQSSKQCIAFLEDLEAGSGIATEDQLRPCRWFTRGWTLQELIAPMTVVFVDKAWRRRGDKANLSQALSRITGIDARVLLRLHPLRKVAVAQRMSWVASRTTTRDEDMAYCLLGIFDINMPLLYGEGKRAFTRLQQAVLQKTADLSIFAWRSLDRKASGLADEDGDDDIYFEAIPFAPFPAVFRGCEVVEQYECRTLPKPSITISNRGIHFATCLANVGKEQALHLQCKMVPDPSKPDEYSILVLPVIEAAGGYLRAPRHVGIESIPCDTLWTYAQVPTEIFLLYTSRALDVPDEEQWLTCGLSFSFTQGAPKFQAFYHPRHLWVPSQNMFFGPWTSDFVCVVELTLYASGPENSAGEEARCWILCGVPNDSATSDPKTRTLWAAVLPETERGTLPLLGYDFDAAGLRNPYCLSSLAHSLRIDDRLKRSVFSGDGKIQCGNRDVTVKLDTRRRHDEEAAGNGDEYTEVTVMFA